MSVLSQMTESRTGMKLFIWPDLIVSGLRRVHGKVGIFVGGTCSDS